MSAPPRSPGLDAAAEAGCKATRQTALRLPAEILAEIVELAILSSSPCPLVPLSSPCAPAALEYSPFSTPLRAAYTSTWAWTARLLYVSKFFYAIARPLLLQTLTLDTDAAAKRFFSSVSVCALGQVERAWFGNISSLARDGIQVDPIRWRLKEAGWYEECLGGFIAGHAYASRLKTKRKARKQRHGKHHARQYRSISVYWAEEQLVEEVRDPTRSSSDESDCSDGSEDEQSPGAHHAIEGGSSTAAPVARSLPLSAAMTLRSPNDTEITVQWRRSYHEGRPSRDQYTDRPHEPVWQTLYSQQHRVSSGRIRSQTGTAMPLASGSSRPPNSSSNGQLGPSEGELDPWDMQDAQERLAAIADPSAEPGDDTSLNPNSSLLPPSSPDQSKAFHSATTAQNGALRRQKPGHRHREIYAYHLCIATLEPWINPLFSSLRSLRLITITFYPGHLLDDDKLEHMLRRILSPNECPRLQTLLIRIVFDAASAGSRLRRFERTKTIAGAVDRIGDERVRVMLINNRVGEGELVALPTRHAGGEGKQESPLSRKAITLTKEAWWARVLKQNHLPQAAEAYPQQAGQGNGSTVGENKVEKHEQQLSNWQMFFPPTQHSNPTHLVNLIHHCDAWPDHPDPVV